MRKITSLFAFFLLITLSLGLNSCGSAEENAAKQIQEFAETLNKEMANRPMGGGMTFKSAEVEDKTFVLNYSNIGRVDLLERRMPGFEEQFNNSAAEMTNTFIAALAQNEAGKEFAKLLKTAGYDVKLNYKFTDKTLSVTVPNADLAAAE